MRRLGVTPAQGSAGTAVGLERSPLDNVLFLADVRLDNVRHRFTAPASAQTILVTGTEAGGDHPAHFHAGDCGGGGDIVVPLSNVAGVSGLSVTTMTAPYDVIVDGDHYLNLHLSSGQMDTIVACGEVGATTR